jgi:hypothetical protein
VTVYRFTLVGRPDIFADAEAQYAFEAFKLARPELVEQNEGKPVCFADVRTTRPREAAAMRLVGAERNAP